MAEDNFLEKARQVDAQALAGLLERSLEPQGITAKVSLKQDGLKVVLESAGTLEQQTLVDFIRQEIIGLGMPSIRTVKVLGKQSGSFDYAWQQEVELEAQVQPAEEITPESSASLETKLDSAYLYLDLEVTYEGRIYSLGWESTTGEEICQGDLEPAYHQLHELKQGGLSVCGHNFRRFDYPYLIKKRRELEPWLVIDTLELSILAFPLKLSHKLEKEYKQSESDRNNPLEDARETRRLLHRRVGELQQKPKALVQTYSWLLACGTSEADSAYRQFFRLLGAEMKKAPELGELPEEALAGFDTAYLQRFWESAAGRDFDSRLCVAALIAWNFEHHFNNSILPEDWQEGRPVFGGSRWLTHLPAFQEIWGAVGHLPEYPAYLERFGIKEWRGKQEEAVQAILGGDRPLVIMATGGGKSLCYQIPALMLFERQGALTVVISPLQALMADQVADLEEIGIGFSTFINGNLPVKERSERLQQLRKPTSSKGLLYISPEQLRSRSIRTLLQERPPALWAIDEAHCISEWGHDFRPDYYYIPKFIRELYQELELPVPLMALTTATATVKVREGIKSLFAEQGLEIASKIIAESSTRDNLEYRVIPVSGNTEQILIQEVQESLSGEGCALVYTTARKNAERLANLLAGANIEARSYHGKLDKNDKDEVLQAFKSGELNAVVATCAFGMGINRADVRAVIHHAMSANLEGYVQETGRAGRDGMPASCTLLFDGEDAETIFYLQSRNQLTEDELRNIFASLKGIRDRTYGKERVSEDWFWATAGEIFHTGELDKDFAENPEVRDIKIKAALQHLEKFGLIERAENLSAHVNFKLADKSKEESVSRFDEWSRSKNFLPSEVREFEQLIAAMYRVKAHYTQQEQPVPLDHLSDESGIDPAKLTPRIRQLQRAGVCSANIPLTFRLTKGVKGDARSQYERIREWEEKLLDELLEIQTSCANSSSQEERGGVQVNLRNLASRLDPDRSKKIRAAYLMDILEGWRAQKWVRLTKKSREVVILKEMEVAEHLERRQGLAAAVLEVLYEKLSSKDGARLRVECELEQLLDSVNQKTHPLQATERELSDVLLWLHYRKLVRLAEGLNLWHQAFKLRVIKGRKESAISSGYKKIKAYYEEQARRTHIMLEYGKLEEPAARQKLISDYFHLSEKEFARAYPNLSTEAVKRPVTEDDYERIMGDLNSAQREIVRAENPALLVIAGPGSGKTRTIVRRIAHLVKVKRIDPDRILVLAYNRNAVRELRLRLQDIIGSAASGLRVYTFHGLALALLGWAQGSERLSNDEEFTKLLKEACDLIELGEESDDGDTQARRIELLGNVEYIFVDEYQDVAEDEYRLIKLIAGLGYSGDESRSVQINLCVIGDDDQNLYEFRKTSPKYIQQFEEEYKARRFLLTENYRSTEPIIGAANNLIRNNKIRCKQKPEEQVRIDSAREGSGGFPVTAFTFLDTSSQAGWIVQKIQDWRSQGIPANDIAVLARQWDNLSPIRLLLERQGIPTYALKGGEIKLVRNRVTCQLIDELNAQSLDFSATEPVKDWFVRQFKRWNRSLDEPTVKTLLKIAGDLDLERGCGSENWGLPVSAGEIVRALLEFNKSEVFLEENAVLVTSCHGAKGLEFRKVILLTDNFSAAYNEIESKRRLFYVSMTRAKDELVLCSTQSSQFVRETGVSSQKIEWAGGQLPQWMLYLDLEPSDVNLGYPATRNSQPIIKTLREGDPLQIKAKQFGKNWGWVIITQQGWEIGNLSKKCTETLRRKGIQVNQFQFQQGEVTVGSIYRHLKTDEITGEIPEDWFVVIPQIRVCR
ncbi:RecQ family ATP-dependent DNA helicase [Kamptonema formosum]|uniref:RecQ family ATP-dependent DNA helicase n=1 Tax=Kamptonema formosum TaxID=331992 RepID=UPI0003451B31|nr:RecQ family ATP-dependent DNA helicase [Oscillatoria sp. PCC 10802]